MKRHGQELQSLNIMEQHFQIGLQTIYEPR